MTESELIPQDADGRPFLSFVYPDEDLVFVWSMRRDEPIEVQYGGEIVRRVPITPPNLAMPLDYWPGFFAGYCLSLVEQYQKGEGWFRADRP